MHADDPTTVIVRFPARVRPYVTTHERTTRTAAVEQRVQAHRRIAPFLGALREHRAPYTAARDSGESSIRLDNGRRLLVARPGDTRAPMQR